MKSPKQQASEWNRHLSRTEYTQRRMPFGRYVNQQIRDLPIDYIKWGIMNLPLEWAEQFSRELQRREPKWR